LGKEKREKGHSSSTLFPFFLFPRIFFDVLFLRKEEERTKRALKKKKRQ
jgi:hypothetical protein